MSIQWITIGDYVVTKEQDQQVDALWLMVTELVTDVTHLRFRAEGEWTVLPGSDLVCGPDGLANLRLAPGMLIEPGSQTACLIGRFGGSSASITGAAAPTVEAPAVGAAAPGGPFAIGRECLLKIPPGVNGPLFIGFNLLPRPVSLKWLNLKVGGANLP